MPEIGEITPGVNKEYDSSKVAFQFSSPFVYKDFYEYDTKINSLNLLESVRLGGPKIIRSEFI